MSKLKFNCCPSLDRNDAPKFFKALGDSNRIAILTWLAEKSQPTNVNEISACCDVDLSVISRHLKTMKEAGVLDSAKQGKEVLYSVKSNELAEKLRSIADYLENCCEPIKKKGKKK